MPTISGQQQKTVNAENLFTDWVKMGPTGILTIEDTSSGNMTITLQCYTKNGTTIDVDTKTAAGRYTFDGGGGDLWRAGCKTGGYTSGTFTVLLQNGNG